MNESVAKEIRRIIYGSDFSQRERKFEKHSEMGGIRNVLGSRRSNYQLLKKIFYREGIVVLRKDPQRYMLKEKPKEIPTAPVYIPVSKYEFMDQAKLTIPKKAEFWMIRFYKNLFSRFRRFFEKVK